MWRGLVLSESDFKVPHSGSDKFRLWCWLGCQGLVWIHHFHNAYSWSFWLDLLLFFDWGWGSWTRDDVPGQKYMPAFHIPFFKAKVQPRSFKNNYWKLQSISNQVNYWLLWNPFKFPTISGFSSPQKIFPFSENSSDQQTNCLEVEKAGEVTGQAQWRLRHSPCAQYITITNVPNPITIGCIL